MTLSPRDRRRPESGYRLIAIRFPDAVGMHTYVLRRVSRDDAGQAGMERWLLSHRIEGAAAPCMEVYGAAPAGVPTITIPGLAARFLPERRLEAARRSAAAREADGSDESTRAKLLAEMDVFRSVHQEVLLPERWSR